MQKTALCLLKFLLFVLPFHAMLVTLASKYLLGGTKDSLPMASFLIASWKEILIFVLAIIGIWQLQKKSFRWQSFDTLILLLIFIHVIWGGYQVFWRGDEVLQVIWGLRTNLEGLLIFWVIRLFSFSKSQIYSFMKIIIISTSLSLLFGLVQLTANCEDLAILGYTPYKSSWVSDKPLPCFHGVGDDLSVVRIMGTFAGPNQLASFLLITIFLTWHGWRCKLFSKYVSLGLLVWQILGLIFTYSRGALLGLLLAVLWGKVEGERGKILLVRYMTVFFMLFVVPIFTIFLLSSHRLDSSIQHIQKPLEGIQRVLDKPFGYGVGLAGPVSQRFPADASKSQIAENWYIQITEEVGIIGGFLAMALLFVLLMSLYTKQKDPQQGDLSKPLFLALLALLVNNMFLHTFASDMSTTILLWILLAFVYKH